MSNVIQIRDTQGNALYPITDASLVIGLQDGPFSEYVMSWDGSSTPTVANIPAGVVVTYNGTNYTGTMAASASTACKVYLVASTTQSGEYDRYITTHTGSSYAWTALGSTQIQSPVVVDNLTTNDATKALSAKQGKILGENVGQLEAEVTDSLFPEIDTEIEKENTLTGKFITSNGSLYDHVSYNVNIYSLVGVSNVRVFALGAIDALVLYGFYSSDDITSANLVELGGNSSSGRYDETVPVPAGATYIAVTIRAGQEQAIISKVESGDALKEIRSSVYDYKQEDVAINDTITGRYIRLSDGNISVYEDYNVYVYNVHGLKKIRLQSSLALVSTTIAAYAFYFNTPSLTTVLQIGPATTETYDYTVNVPEGAEYLAVSALYGQITRVFADVPVLISEKLQSEIEDISSTVNDAVNTIDAYHPVFPIGSSMTATRTDSGKFLKENGGEDSHANYSVLVYDLTGISKVNIYGKNGNSVVRAYNFYNSDTLSPATLVSAGPEMSTNYNYNVDVPAGATFLACTKFHTQTLSVSKFTPEQVTNEVKVENGNTVTLCVPSGNKKLYMVIGPTDPGVGNGLIDFRYWGYVPLGGDLESTPTELYHSSSDCFGPFRIKALSNIDGDDVDSDNFTGGSHQYNNNITGSTPTARLGNVEIRVDGVRVDSFRGAFHEFEMIWEAFVQANNTRKSDGTGREVLKEIITLKYIGGEFLCRTELVPLEDISIYRWYGYQTCGYNPGDPPSIGDYWYYVNATNRGLNNEKSGNKDAVGMVAWTDDFSQEMWIDTSIDLGKRIFVTDNIDNGVFRSGAKAYFMIVDFANTIYANNRYLLDGKYIFKLK